MLVRRLDFGPGVRDALRFTFERWNGNGFPTHARGEAIPLAMRVVHLSHDMEAIARLFSSNKALEAVRERRDSTYDPKLADVFAAHGRSWLDRIGKVEPWDAVLDLEPRTPASRRPQHPSGLSRREVEVLHLAAKGLTTQQIADRLYISPKTADHHIQHVYTKIGVSTRAAAALWAMQHAAVNGASGDGAAHWHQAAQPVRIDTTRSGRLNPLCKKPGPRAMSMDVRGIGSAGEAGGTASNATPRRYRKHPQLRDRRDRLPGSFQ